MVLLRGMPRLYMASSSDAGMISVRMGSVLLSAWAFSSMKLRKADEAVPRRMRSMVLRGVPRLYMASSSDAGMISVRMLGSKEYFAGATGELRS